VLTPFPGVKRPGRGVDHPPSSSARAKERVEQYLYSPSGPSWPVLGRTLPLPFSAYAMENIASAVQSTPYSENKMLHRGVLGAELRITGSYSLVPRHSSVRRIQFEVNE
jgi:hypothetical protein